ncbi:MULTISPECIES: phosphonate metabolism protein/1,5-bisphosphokinase (PRPP-forming) PhnN [unclassified Chelatococcus]|uniref:phosphonate metabolism protein/1,5-bisphosphokinase (PRPP-forming) PhnN n=1 Tax=unclassified Chelatococcus TaxID=2638111 RepID=UPI001BCC3C8B|nr:MULTISPECIES: phosphonate metabolism protein/1,5-bisphosphokinase (PRPP-forming) PhnN [unclassified Chelatococcus]CAH1663259.1 Ribose 1,5-bisphosphate phosphokinase PhnN [Hyphomicrobiales bacterium]MBS7741549.1 phosphonate metabolism protein/1,5-bisphosphokinase (PRPP-forming) PhnN [Chelatococcus sp. HY11]MBX3544432.1 phosphonate metabolism protein/1,5-bisphosphokinase (PRPP-forming) PhnN [Chelatococcus sp.]MCO5079045.1 phosphonate metabolism protein/1,5-bisphosphokinase (PRPP-forming) PhnN 
MDGETDVSLRSQEDRAPEELIGPGRLILVVGPSGAGKDSVLRGARDRLAHDARYVFPRRSVTRPPSADEDNLSLNEDAFVALIDADAFALHWRAHGHRYGVPRAIDTAIARGATVICNVSRTVLDTARLRYQHVTVVGITASRDVLAARIFGRARESEDEATKRLDRAAALRSIRVDVEIDNGGALDDAVTAFVAVVARPN